MCILSSSSFNALHLSEIQCAGYRTEKIYTNLYEDLSFKGLTVWKYMCCVCIWCICTQSLSFVWLFVIPWTVACQAPLSMGFSRQEYWSGLPFPTPEDLPDSRIKPMSPASPALAGRFFTTADSLPGKPLKKKYIIINVHVPMYTQWEEGMPISSHWISVNLPLSRCGNRTQARSFKGFFSETSLWAGGQEAEIVGIKV